jgi:hypothetical protein
MSDNVEIELQYIVINGYGEFKGETLIVNEEQYANIMELSKTFYNSGFELNCEDGSYMVFPPDVVRGSILKINRKVIEKDV